MPLQIIRQDITKMRVGAIVNTTNGGMVGYSGVDLAVHTVAGPELDEECAKLPCLELGHACVTGGYHLPCKHVIHTVGPVWRGGHYGEDAILRSCYIECLKLAVAHKCKTVAFPLISSGVYCFPKDMVLKFAIQTITEFLVDHELTVYLCVFDRESYSFSQKLFDDIKAFIDDDYVDEHGEDFYDDYEDDDVAEKTSPVLFSESKCAPPPVCASEMPAQKRDVSSAMGKSLRDYLQERDQSFQEMLFELIDKSGMTDVECYKKANVDKRIFSKIKSNKSYRPSKQTAVAFAISLRLDLEETQALLATAGMTLSRANTFDKIIRYFIYHGNYNVYEINEALFEFDQVLLGSL